MAEVFLEYRTLLFTDDGQAYSARACGGESGDGTNRWLGWIEFLPLEGGPAIRTARETTQPNRTCLLYWSTGLTPVYLDGALTRALRVTRALQLEARRSVHAPPKITSAGASGRSPHGSQSASIATRTATLGTCLTLTQSDRAFLRSLGIAPA